MGLMAGFAAQGIDFRNADTIIGTSAGAIVGAQLALNLDLGMPPIITASPSPDFGKLADLAAIMMRAMQSPDPEPLRAEIGKLALNAQTISEDESVFRFNSFIGQGWPSQFRATTISARTGRLHVWDASSGAPLERAIAASAAAPGFWPPITINGGLCAKV
jgi:NTE family protein